MYAKKAFSPVFSSTKRISRNCKKTLNIPGVTAFYQGLHLNSILSCDKEGILKREVEDWGGGEEKIRGLSDKCPVHIKA